MGYRVRSVGVAVLLAVPALLAPPAAAQECPSDPSPDRLAPLAAAVEAALPTAPSRAESRRLSRARDALLRRGSTLVSAAVAFQGAAKELDRIPGDPFLPALSDAYSGLRDDVAEGVLDLREVLLLFPGSGGERARARVVVLATKADLAMADGRSARAAGFLLRAVRALGRAREPRVETYGGPLRVISVSVEGVSEVHLNRPVVIRFSDRLDPSSVRADTVQVRRGPNYAVQVQGTYETRGPMVVFRPRLPTQADLSDAGFQPGAAHRVVLPGHPSTATVRGEDGRPHARLYTADFQTAVDPLFYFSIGHYVDPPPPRVVCTEPRDSLPAAPWSDAGGAKQVPTATPIRLVLNRVPLLPAAAARPRADLVMTSFRGEPVRIPMPGRVALVQDADRVALEFVPQVPLPDRSRFVFRVSSLVTDLTGHFPVADHPGRAAIAAAAALEQATDPSGPLATLARENSLELDPRTYLVFTTADEAPADAERLLAFDGTDVDIDGGDGADRTRTSASFNSAIPGAVAAVLTVAGGDGRLGVLDPSSSTHFDGDAPEAPGGVFHFQRIHIRKGVTLTATGSRPVVLRSVEDAVIEGTVLGDGATGGPAESSQTSAFLPLQFGGIGGPGGGAGGDSFTGATYGMRGGSGEDAAGGGGGGGEGGGETAQSVPFCFPGGGGGGGHRDQGGAGAGGSWPSNGSYNGPGGTGGDAGGDEPTSQSTDQGRDFSGTGGGGGGAGGNGHYVPFGYRTSGAGGGGGGGGILISTAGNLRVSGVVSAVGGHGGASPVAGTYAGAPGGGGAGGSVALFAAGDLDITGGRFLVRGGLAGALLGTIWTGAAGAGSHGFVRFEDRDGLVAGLTAASVPDGLNSIGVFDPASSAADPPSVFTSTWFLVPAFRPTVLPFLPEDLPGATIPGAETTWEIQMADEHPFVPGRPDLAPVDPATGASSDPGRASGWVVLRDAAGIRDVASALNGRGYQFFRIRISFRLPDGVRRGDPLPRADGFRIRVRHQE